MLSYIQMRKMLPDLEDVLSTLLRILSIRLNIFAYARRIIAHKFDSLRSDTEFVGKKSLKFLNVVRLSSVANLSLEIN
jgi:hypothetical protein